MEVDDQLVKDLIQKWKDTRRPNRARDHSSALKRWNAFTNAMGVFAETYSEESSLDPDSNTSKSTLDKLARL